MMLTYLASCVLTLTSPQGATVKGQSADDLIKAIKATQEPPFPGGNDEAVAKWEAECDKVAAKQGTLIWELYERFPAHPETPTWLYNRWDSMSGHRMPCELVRLDKIDADIQAFLAKPQLEANKTTGLLWQARATMLRQWREMITAKVSAKTDEAKPYLTKALKACDDFQRSYPQEQRGVFQFYNFSQMAKGSEFEKTALSRMVNLYPEHRLAKSSKGRLHALTMIDKPFELSFRDVLTDKPIDIKEYRGRVVLIDFWATWCAPCKADIEGEMLKMAKDLEPRGLSIIGISVDVPEADGGRKMLLDYIKDKGITWPNFYSGKKPEDGMAGEWGVSGYPRQFLIDRNGVLRYLETGNNRAALIEKLLAEPAPK